MSYLTLCFAARHTSNNAEPFECDCLRQSLYRYYITMIHSFPIYLDTLLNNIIKSQNAHYCQAIILSQNFKSQLRRSAGTTRDTLSVAIFIWKNLYTHPSPNDKRYPCNYLRRAWAATGYSSHLVCLFVTLYCHIVCQSHLALGCK